MIKTFTSNFVALIITFLFSIIIKTPVFSRQVLINNAKIVAESFWKKNCKIENLEITLKHTSTDANGVPLYYVFNINSTGFVIVSAEDSGYPIIGYSNEQVFEQPNSGSPAFFWLEKRKEEIKFLKQNNIHANTQITSQWNQYLYAPIDKKIEVLNSVIVAPLTTTKWAQTNPYNIYCPGGSVTGCCPTTMAQIMKYWSYPIHGTGSSSYGSSYGILSANYAARTYNWNNMPTTLTSANADVAQLMFDCGVSIHATYSPSQTGGAVINLDNPISAENSYITYFGYNPSILGAYRSSYSDSVWLSMIKNDLDLSRPVQYFGIDTIGPSGHTWVCDGYDQNDFFHMNWGWGGSSNGYFNINSLNPTGYNFTSFHEGLLGIVPIANNLLDLGIVSISATSNGCSNNLYTPIAKIRNCGINPITSCTINYKLDNGITQTIAWTGSLVTGQSKDVTIANYTLSNAQHSFTCFLTNVNNGADLNLLNDTLIYNFSIFGADNLPISEGFENVTTTSNHWIVLPSGSSDWIYTNQTASSGSKSIMINNLSNTPGNISILQGLNSYDFSNTNDPAIYFKLAYQRKATNNTDKLMLQISNDCGNTWWTKWSKQGAALATTTVLSNSNFVPLATDFTQCVSYGIYTSNTIFRWVFIADATNPGNNIYIDDISIYDTSSVGIEEQKIDFYNFEIYPNPSNGETFLKFNLKNPSNVEIKVTDIFGKEVIKEEKLYLTPENNLVSINKEHLLAKGVYLITASINGSKLVRKLLIV